MHQSAHAQDRPLYRYRFGNAEYDQARHELRLGGLLVELEQRPLQVLECLLLHADEVVTREELFDTVWSGRPTVDNVLPNAVAKLRKGLGAADGRRIRTLPRVGYRLDGPVERSVAGRRLSSRLDLAAGMPVPGRGHFTLERQLGPAHGSEVWLARHAKTGEARVYKFSTDGEHLAALKREATLYRVLRDTLGEREDFVRVLDWNFETPPFYLECEYGGPNLAEWAAGESGLESLDLGQRLELFLQIADGIAAAHGVGVLHKDLKPANVLVQVHDGQLHLRIADFGSGRLLDPERLDRLGITALGMTMTQAVSADSATGTPLYLAPELLAGQSPTVRSDLYALGLILYQMAIADLRRPLASGWEQDIGDELLCEDIAAATDGNPSRRLASVGELAERLRQRESRRSERRRLDAAEARAQRAEQLLERSRARRPWMFTAAALLLVGLSISLWQFSRARHALQEAKQQTAIANASNQFLNEDILGAGIGGDSPAWYERNPPLREILDAASRRLDQRFGGGPLLLAGLHQTLGRAYRSTGAFAKAAVQLEAASRLLQRGLGPGNERSLRARYELAVTEADLSHFTKADALLASADTTAGTRIGGVSELALRAHLAHGDVLYQELKIPRALHEYQLAKNLQSLLRPNDASLAAHLLLAIAGCDLRMGRPAEAEKVSRRILAGAPFTQDRVGLASLALARMHLGDALRGQGRYREAIPILQQAVEEFGRAEGADSHLALGALSTLGYMYSMTGDKAKSLQTQRQVYRLTLHRWGAQSQTTLVELLNLGSDEYDTGDLKNALVHLRKAEAGLRAISGDTGPLVQAARVEEASVLSELGRNREALAMLDRIDPKAYQATTADPGRAFVLQALKAQVRMRMGVPGSASQLRRAIADMRGAKVSEEEIKPFRAQLASATTPR